MPQDVPRGAFDLRSCQYVVEPTTWPAMPPHTSRRAR